MATIYGVYKGQYTASSHHESREEAISNTFSGDFLDLVSVEWHDSVFPQNPAYKSGWVVEPCPYYSWYSSEGMAREDLERLQQRNPDNGWYKTVVTREFDAQFVVAKSWWGLIYCGKTFRDRLAIKGDLDLGVRHFSKDTQSLVQSVLGADGGEIHGLSLSDLYEIESVSEPTKILVGEKSECYSPKTIDRYHCTRRDGSTRNLYSYSVGYFEGYSFELFPSQKAAYTYLQEEVAAIAKQDWVLTECLECGSTFLEAGHVEPDGMGCDRCNN